MMSENTLGLSVNNFLVSKTKNLVALTLSFFDWSNQKWWFARPKFGHPNQIAIWLSQSSQEVGSAYKISMSVLVDNWCVEWYFENIFWDNILRIIVVLRDFWLSWDYKNDNSIFKSTAKNIPSRPISKLGMKKSHPKKLLQKKPYNFWGAIFSRHFLGWDFSRLFLRWDFFLWHFSG